MPPWNWHLSIKGGKEHTRIRFDSNCMQKVRYECASNFCIDSYSRFIVYLYSTRFAVVKTNDRCKCDRVSTCQFQLWLRQADSWRRWSDLCCSAYKHFLVCSSSVNITAIVIVTTSTASVAAIVKVLSIICSLDVLGLTLAHAKHQEEDHDAEDYPLKEGLRAKWLLYGLVR